MPINPNEITWDEPQIDLESVKWDEKPMSWRDVPLASVKAIPSSAKNFATSIYDAVRHPIDTASNVIDLAAGGLRNITPQPISDFIDRANTPEMQRSADRASAVADAVGGMYRDRYGSVEGLKRTLATDPVGVAGDLSTVLGGGAAIAPKTSKLASILAKGSQLTNPLTAVVEGGKLAGKVTGTVGSNILGLTTGVGKENIAQALRSGVEGKTAFMDNLTGNASMTDVLDAAKQNVRRMGEQKAKAYREGMKNIKGDKTILDVQPIADAVDESMKMATYEGKIKNQAAYDALKKIKDMVADYQFSDPAKFHTPEGLDALKQTVGAVVESIPFEQKTARTAASGVYNSIKKQISDQAPTYSKVMKDYSEASDLITEIERALSLGPKGKPSADTAMRKLQSLTRNNVNTNYGNRLDLAKTLEAAGGNELMPALAGQAMNSWAARGLTGQAGNMGTLGLAMMHNPAIGLALPFQSPKAVGSTLYGVGRATGFGKQALAKIPFDQMTPAQKQAAVLMAFQAGRINSAEDVQE
jgi:hypothetical protein